MNYEKDGYVIYQNIFNKYQINEYRNMLDTYFENSKSFRYKDGKAIPGFAGITPDLMDLNILHQNNILLDIVKKVIKNEFIFLGQSDLHQDMITDWHRDMYDYQKGGGNIQNIWNKDCHIVKVCILLQDHIDNKLGLSFQPATHLSNINSKPIHALTNSTDIILFDQRILHKGQAGAGQYYKLYNKHRYLITYAFGLNNSHSRYHILGAKKRQAAQRAKMI